MSLRRWGWLSLSLMLGLLAPGLALSALPAGAVRHLPVLIEEAADHWPDAPLPSALAAQIEQETCISLTHRFCWNPAAELKTSREYGFGLGQLTITSRFNAWDEVKAMDRSLSAWDWKDRHDPRMQIRALVIKDRFNWRAFPDAAGIDRLAFAVAAYNGGVGGIMADRRVCRATAGCDPVQWFGHVERTSLKNKVAVKGYGQSFFQINRDYVVNVLIKRRQKYVPLMEGRHAG